MKKISFLIILFVAVSVTSCYKEAMDYYPTDQLTPDKVFATEENAEAALLGVYARFAPGWYKYYIINLEVYGNKDFNPGSKLGGLYAIYTTHVMSPADGSLYKGYKRVWAVILYANSFIRGVQNTRFLDPDRKAQAIGEARFLRAWSYFQLVQLWGRVPLITDQENYGVLYPSNSTEDEIYRQILDDLEYCIKVLPDSYEKIVSSTVEPARVTRAAAQGILAKVLMTPHTWGGSVAPEDLQRAAELCQEILDNPAYDLLPNFDDLWDKENTYNKEQIFTVALSNQGSANGIDWSVYAAHDFEPTRRFYDSFDYDSVAGINSVVDTFTDLRRDATLYMNPISKTILDSKYRRAGMGTSPNHSNPNLYVLRLADIILLRAEALNRLDYDAHKQEIVDLVNRVRNRAGAVPTTLTECSDPQKTARIIEEERHKELFFEFQEFYDLKRNNRLIEVLGRNGADLGLDNPYQTLWPFPVSEINKNSNLIQNEGY